MDRSSVLLIIALGLLVLAITIYIIINFWHIILSLIVFTILIIFTALKIRDILAIGKINRIRKSNVILIYSTNLYAIPIEVIENKNSNQKYQKQWIVNSIFPELNNGIVNFTNLDRDLEKVKITTSKDRDYKSFKTAQSVAYMTQEIYQRMNPRIEEAREQIEKLRRGKTLALSSRVYQAKAETFSNRIEQLQSFVEQTNILKEKYTHFIRESLIGSELSQFNLEAQPNDLEYQAKLQAEFSILNEKYEDLKNEINAYVELSKDRL